MTHRQPCSKVLYLPHLLIQRIITLSPTGNPQLPPAYSHQCSELAQGKQSSPDVAFLPFTVSSFLPPIHPFIHPNSLPFIQMSILPSSFCSPIHPSVHPFVQPIKYLLSTRHCPMFWGHNSELKRWTHSHDAYVLAKGDENNTQTEINERDNFG